MFGLSFLSPLFLVGAAAAIVPIAIHLLHRRVEPVIEFAAMRYLRQAPVEQSQRRRLRDLLLLALRVAALVLLACAFARPYLPAVAASAASEGTIVLIDTSASLTAPGQFQRVRERAEQVVREAPLPHLVGVLSFATTVDVVAPLSSSRAAALGAIARLEAGAGATRFQAALRRAGEELAGRTGRIVVITDLQQSGWDAAPDGGVPENVEVVVEEIDGPDGNVAITSLRVEERAAVAGVRNFSARPATEQVVFEVDGRRIGAVPLVLPPDGSSEAKLPLDRVASGVLRASISERDGYAADNERYAVVDAHAGTSVLAVTAFRDGADALYLRRALGVADGADGFRFEAADASRLAALDDDPLAGVDVVVLLATRGLEQRGRERLTQFLLSGGGLLVAAGPDSDSDSLRPATGVPRIVGTSWRIRENRALTFAPDDGRHPVFRLFRDAGTLGGVSFSRAVQIDSAPGAQVIARFTDGTPALVEERASPERRGSGGADPGGRVLVFASDLNNRWNDFPLHPAFVPFVHETIRYLASPRPVSTDYLVGELSGPRGAVPGVVALNDGGTPRRARQVAVNTDPRESDPRRMSKDAFQAGISRLKEAGQQQASADVRQTESQQGLWRYGLLLVILGLAAEGLLGRRSG